MDPQTVFCPNPDCPARGRTGRGNIGVHSQTERRYICHECEKTFAAFTGTVFYRLRTDPETVVRVVTLLAHGCPVQAVVAAFGLDERTVCEWQARAGQHCERVHQHLVQQPRDLGQVQADELRVKKQGGIVWMALAIQVATRLWLGGVIRAHRDFDLIATLVRLIRACALCRPLLFCTDGFKTYVRAIRTGFRERLLTGRPGRPRLQPWDNVCIAQVVKQYARRRVVAVARRVIQGPLARIEELIQHTQVEGVINTAYIERLNATFRARLTGLVRRGRALARHIVTLQQGMYLIGTIYNFCTDHDSLRLPTTSPNQKWWSRTPAMAAGITDHLWTVYELLTFQVPLPNWTPPRRRGRMSKVTQRLAAKWCT